MFKVPCGQDPYDSVGEYIREHITAIEDIIAVIEINGITTNQLFMVDMQENGYFVWESDWWEGEENIVLLDFFPVSEAIKPPAQLDSKETSSTHKALDTVSRQAAIDAIKTSRFLVDAMEKVIKLPSAQHWIPCSERLPEDEYVLISKKPSPLSGSKWSVDIAIRMEDPRSRKIQWRDSGFGVIQDDKVLAWMPLPEPWKGDTQE